MRRVILFLAIAGIFAVDMLTGRAIFNGLDSLIPRSTKAHPAPHKIEIKLGNGKILARDIWCEDYYDAQGGTRGNFWAVREKGMLGMLDASREKVSVEGIGVVSFIMPTCAELTEGSDFTVSQMVLLINGVVYGHKSSNGDIHTFIPRHAHEGKDTDLQFTVSINERKMR